METPDRIVVFGHKGFIGGRVYAALQDRYGAELVKGLDLPETDLTQVESLEREAAQWTSRTILVLVSGIKKQRGDNLALFADNVAIAETVAHAIEAHPVGRLVFFSSADVYGEDIENTSISESTPVCPRSFYGMAKFASEGILSKTVEAAGGSMLSLRPPLIYGPHEAETFYGPTGFARRARKGETITLWGDGEELREFLFIDDIVAVVLALVASEVTGVVNPVAGQSYRFSDILDILRDQGALLFETDTRPRSKSKVDNAFVADRIRELCPGIRMTTLAEGLARILEEEA